MVFLRFTCTMLFAKLLDSELFFISRRILEGEKNGKKTYLHQPGTSTCVFFVWRDMQCYLYSPGSLSWTAWAGRYHWAFPHLNIYAAYLSGIFHTKKTSRIFRLIVHGIYISDFSLMLLNDWMIEWFSPPCRSNPSDSSSSLEQVVRVNSPGMRPGTDVDAYIQYNAINDDDNDNHHWVHDEVDHRVPNNRRLCKL